MGKVWLCGGQADDRACINFDGKQFNPVPSTQSGHREGAMVNFRGSGVSETILSPVIIGGCFLQCRYSSGAVEKWYDDFGGFWQQLAAVPTRSGELQAHSAVATEEKIFVFGDLNYPNVYSYNIDENKWIQEPNLLVSRYGHKSIAVDNYFVHVGGRGTKPFERWWDDGRQRWASQSALDNFAYYPEVHLLNIEDIQSCL